MNANPMLDALQAEVDALKRLHSETAAELDALIPDRARRHRRPRTFLHHSQGSDEIQLLT